MKELLGWADSVEWCYPEIRGSNELAEEVRHPGEAKQEFTGVPGRDPREALRMWEWG